MERRRLDPRAPQRLLFEAARSAAADSSQSMRRQPQPSVGHRADRWDADHEDQWGKGWTDGQRKLHQEVAPRINRRYNWERYIVTHRSPICMDVSSCDLRDSDLMSLLDFLGDYLEGSQAFEFDINLSSNCNITDNGVGNYLVPFLMRRPWCKRLKLFGTGISSESLVLLGDWAAKGYAHEMHLSDLQGGITSAGVCRFLEKIAKHRPYPYRRNDKQAPNLYTALWLRLEQNGLRGTSELVRRLNEVGVSFRIIDRTELDRFRPGDAGTWEKTPAVNLVLFDGKQQKSRSDMQAWAHNKFSCYERELGSRTFDKGSNARRHLHQRDWQDETWRWPTSTWQDAWRGDSVGDGWDRRERGHVDSASRYGRHLRSSDWYGECLEGYDEWEEGYDERDEGCDEWGEGYDEWDEGYAEWEEGDWEEATEGYSRPSRSSRRRKSKRGESSLNPPPTLDHAEVQAWREEIAYARPCEPTLDDIPLELLKDRSKNVAAWEEIVADSHLRCWMFHTCQETAITEDDLETLLDNVPWETLVSSKGNITRKTCWMVRAGCSCQYAYGKELVEATPFPDWFKIMMRRWLHDFNLGDDLPNSVNLNLYEHDGHAVGWHADDEPLFCAKTQDARIISVSLGSSRRFRIGMRVMRKGPKIAPEKGTVSDVVLEHGAICTMEGLFQKHWLHQIAKGPKRNSEGGHSRVNATFRWIVNHARPCPLHVSTDSTSSGASDEDSIVCTRGKGKDKGKRTGKGKGKGKGKDKRKGYNRDVTRPIPDPWSKAGCNWRKVAAINRPVDDDEERRNYRWELQPYDDWPDDQSSSSDDESSTDEDG